MILKSEIFINFMIIYWLDWYIRKYGIKLACKKIVIISFFFTDNLEINHQWITKTDIAKINTFVILYCELYELLEWITDFQIGDFFFAN